METNALKARIAGWLEATQDAEIPVGLDAAEAKTRAQALFQGVQELRLAPDQVSLDDDFKQVLSALVTLLKESQVSPESRLKDADAVYQFIRGVPWRADSIGEQQDLLRECAEIGWAAIGMTFEDLRRLRFDDNFASSQLRAYRLSAIGFSPNPLEVLGLLRARRNTVPKSVLEQATAVYDSLSSPHASVGVFDDREYFLGESACIAGAASWLLGHREKARGWLDQAEANFQRMSDSEPAIARVRYARLAQEFEEGHRDGLAERISLLRTQFERLGMMQETAKCLLVEAMVLKGQGKCAEALRLLESIQKWDGLCPEPGLKGRILAEVGDLLQLANRFDDAMVAYEQALQEFEGIGVSPGRADLKAFVGEAFRTRGRFDIALEAFRSAVADQLELGLESRVAYLRVHVADILMALGRPQEAEAEILAALPTIEEQKMVPEGFAAVALLKESIRRRKTDRNALRELREHLQKQR